MKTRSKTWWLAAPIVAMVWAVSSPLAAQDAPHWARDGFPMDCTSSCHVPHQASGGAITQAATNVDIKYNLA